MKRIYVDDAVRVIDRESVHYGKVGITLPNTADHMYLVALDSGRIVHHFRRDEIALVARKGTKLYSEYILNGEIKRLVQCDDRTDLNVDDYLALIDLALDLKDFELAKQWFDDMRNIK